MCCWRAISLVDGALPTAGVAYAGVGLLLRCPSALSSRRARLLGRCPKGRSTAHHPRRHRMPLLFGSLSDAAPATSVEKSATSGSDRPKTAERAPGMPGSLKFITWDTNGLEHRNLLPRTQAGCSIIRDADPDVVFLQEVVPESDVVIWPVFQDYRTVIFGGNLGLRGHELKDVGGRPRSLVDVWERCGRRREVRYTWDMVVNDNRLFNFCKNPQYRPDRVYLKACKPATMVPASFDLIGTERLSPLGCFPSDHWGLVCRFNVL
ncbi:hypothetical protein HPB49_007902 [Dermacentor silvarum]|uniref:Uncharacterized protein n=1 Tax=Dermacentor silvarum TaxID=543639 RepID=A0ACB8DP18_DERSI|nr:hypothetical protein HPB49_007902 [Dermacentor silvarum]